MLQLPLYVRSAHWEYKHDAIQCLCNQSCRHNVQIVCTLDTILDILQPSQKQRWVKHAATNYKLPEKVTVTHVDLQQHN